MKNESFPVNGSCLCGDIAFEITGKPEAFRYCACRSCQKTTGSAHAANVVVSLDALTWTKGEKLISRFIESKNNEGFPTWFCSVCGSFLPHIGRSGEVYVIPAGLLDSEIEIRPEEVIYWEEAPQWYLSPEKMPRHKTSESMNRKLISSGSPYEEKIAYSRAVVDGDDVFVSGTTGFDYETMSISDNVIEQAEQCFKNIEKALEEAGSSLAQIVRVHYIFPDKADFEPCWPVFSKYLGDVRPAATMFEAGLLDERMKLEIEVTAAR